MIIHAHVWDPTAPSLFVKRRAGARAEFHTVKCSRPEGCELYARGACIARIFQGPKCRHGDAQITCGPTSRSRKFWDWMKEHRTAAERVGSMKAPATRFARVHDAYWLPYQHMDAALEVITKQRGQFIAVEAMTPEVVAALCEARPRGWFSAPLPDYQRTSVPLFVAHLSERLPDLLHAAAPLSARIREVMATLTKVGRTAKLWTIRPHVGDFNGWTWTGAEMVATERRSFPPYTPFEAVQMRICPGPDALVKVTDDAQVGPETVLID